MTQRLTVNLGLRYEFMNTPRELQGKQSRQINDATDAFTLGPVVKNNTLRDFSPRVGLAYDLFGNGKTAIRGGAGIYYDMGNIGEALGGTTEGALPYGALIDVGIGCSSNYLQQNHLPGFSVRTCSIPDWENALVGTTANGFPLPIPNAMRNAYTPNVLGVFTPTFIDYNYLSPNMIQYNASVEQQLPWNIAVGVAYVGNHGVHLPLVRDGNPILPTSQGPCGDPASLCVNGSVPQWDNGAANYVNRNPNFGSDINVATVGDSHYNALEVQVQKRTSHGLEFEAAYTHSRVTDETQGQANVQDCIVSGGLLGVYPLAPKVDKGPACFNIPNNWEFNALYHFPNRMAGNGFAAKVLNGWFMSSIVSIQSGQPFTPIVDANRSNSGVAQGQQGEWVNINTPALLAAHPCNAANPCAYTPVVYDPNTVITGNPDQWFNPNMFSIAPAPLSANQPACFAAGTCPPNTIGQLGTAGRNILSGPPERNWDFSIVKETKLGFLGEGGMLEFRAEFFNILNHTNFSGDGLRSSIFAGNAGDVGPFSEAPHGNAGAVTKQLKDNQRQIQFALRLEF